VNIEKDAVFLWIKKAVTIVTSEEDIKNTLNIVIMQHFYAESEQ